MSCQSIRPSQFVTSYGPGAILEGPDGPRVILSLEKSGVFGQESPARYQILDSNLKVMLAAHGNPLPVSLPTNAQRRAKDDDAIYETAPFPSWSLCVDHGFLYRHNYSNLRTGCPLCAPLKSKNAAFVRARREAIRFVAACPAGHLDDVNWHMVVKHTNPQCQGGLFRWQGGGSALRNISIICDVCGGEGNLGAAYSRTWPCRGHRPENKFTEGSCGQEAHILQRGAANLYTTELITSVTVPRMDTQLHNLLGSVAVLSLLTYMKIANRLTGQEIRAALQGNPTFPPLVSHQLSLVDDGLLERTAREVLEHQAPADIDEARRIEFRELQKAASHGHPLQASTTPGGPPLFEILKTQVRERVECGGLSLRVTPVSRLRVVTAQLGYRRTLGSQPGDLVSSAYTYGADSFIPAVELFGEGIFIDLTPLAGEHFAPSHPPLDGEAAHAWLEHWRETGEQTHHPVFVWWHTLAHRLVRALGIDSGYSSSAVRERVYVRINPANGSASGGVLLYTAQPGGDGTLGGLIALVPTFERVLASALRDVDACSNDPLCADEQFRPGRANGAMCYACGFISETSCEFRNQHLDRNLLL